MFTASPPLDPAALDSLVNLLRGRRFVVLAGAGCSTESGIPDYRGVNAGPRVRKPIQYQEFVASEAGRARYWARSTLGWPRVETARPNPAHQCLARLETSGAIGGIITQNVDGLHHAAGNLRVVELHGSLAWVCCLSCGERVSRSGFQQRLLALNAAWTERMRRDGSIDTAPDGDADLPAETLSDFKVPACGSCGGIVKPDVVFFGENVPTERVREAWRIFDEGEALLVVGSSLTVYSGRRFVYRAQEKGVPIGVVNLGPTRADEVAAARVEGRLGVVLPRLAAALLGEHQ